jgi:NAD(P)-dependent dehydrogenase (short-subunit alcohol dehydrogenase family)
MSTPIQTLLDLTGRSALVTGGSRGLGLQIAEALGEAGAKILLTSRKAGDLEEAAAHLQDRGIDTRWIAADASQAAEIQRVADEAMQRLGHIDILVNNAGATWGAPLEEFPASAWDKLLDLNLKAPFFLTRALLPLLEAAATPDDPARVINVGSIDGLTVPAFPTYAYAASKAGLHHLTRVLARELGPRRITVNAVAPGPFESKMMAQTLRDFGDAIAASSPLGRIGRPDDMAGVALYLAGRAGAYVTGAVIPVDGGIATTR